MKSFRYIQATPKLHPSYTQVLPKLHPRYIQGTSKVHLRYTSYGNFSLLCFKYFNVNKILLPLSQIKSTIHFSGAHYTMDSISYFEWWINFFSQIYLAWKVDMGVWTLKTFNENCQRRCVSEIFQIFWNFLTRTRTRRRSEQFLANICKI